MGVTSYTNCTAKKYSIYVELGNKAACAACHVIFYSVTKSGWGSAAFVFYVQVGTFQIATLLLIWMCPFTTSVLVRLTQAQAHRSPLCGSHRPKPTKAPSAAHPTKAPSAAHPTETPSTAHTGPSPPKPAQLPKKTPLIVLHTALTLLYPTVFECR